MSTLSKGENKEKSISLKHADKTALLVSGLLLRRIGAGQVDFCYVENGRIRILEVKSSIAGVLAHRRSQAARLRASGEFLSHICGLECSISVV